MEQSKPTIEQLNDLDRMERDLRAALKSVPADVDVVDAQSHSDVFAQFMAVVRYRMDLGLPYENLNIRAI